MDLDSFDLATKFINTTQSHIFLTGKAGTGKTTFLKNISQFTYKTYIVVAPTGIAALNAGGVTIHSQFLFPPATILPEKDLDFDLNNPGAINHKTLSVKYPLNSHRTKLLRSIDLLVIDEVSMLRADLVDAIDYRLKSARGNFDSSFGGVQVLFIGDLHQLPPIIKKDDYGYYNYYKTSWFYDSIVIKNSSLIYIELNKIFRQHEANFIKILNHLRNNQLQKGDLDKLNSYYQSEKQISTQKDVITLTTHNHIAETINNNRLNGLSGTINYYIANTEGEYPDNMFPTNHKIGLKIGAQIMFVRNDVESNKYYNGKLATVIDLSSEEIIVKLAETHERYCLKKVKWENKKYLLNPATQLIEESVLGSFEQYPIRLAWAITIHKSQGLTFEKAIIDVGKSFATGQVYVALSRLKSLDGLILRSKIAPNVITTNPEIVGFERSNHHPEKLNAEIVTRQELFINQLINETFEFSELQNQLRRTKQFVPKKLSDSSSQSVISKIELILYKEKESTEKFRHQLMKLIETNSKKSLLDRLQKGSAYYKKLLFDQLEILLFYMASLQYKKGATKYLNRLVEIDQLFTKKWSDLEKVKNVIEGIFNGTSVLNLSKLNKQQEQERNKLIDKIESVEQTLNFLSRDKFNPKSLKLTKSVKPKIVKETTYEKTLKLFKKGLDTQKIAKERSMVVTTIESHLTRLFIDGEIEIFSFIPEENVNEIAKSISENSTLTLYATFMKLNKKYSYSELKAVRHFMKSKP